MQKIYRENDLGRDGIKKLLIKLAFPAMIAQLVNVLYGIVDRIYVGNIRDIGKTALAGLGISAPIMTLSTSFCFLVGLGGAPLVAMKLGAKDKEGAQKIFNSAFFSLIVASAAVTAAALLLKGPMLRLFGASENTFSFADDYLTIYLAGLTFAILSLGLNNFITCQGFSKTRMMTILIGAVLNIALDPVFIFALNMGVKGAAYATVISEAASLLWVLLFLSGKRTGIKLSLKNINFKNILKIAKLGTSPFLIIATDSIILIILNTVLQRMGGQEADLLITAATITLSFMQLYTLPMGGITMGSQPIISFNYGAKSGDRIKKAFFGVNIICLVFGAFMTICALLLGKYFVYLFSKDPFVIQKATRFIKFYSVGFIFLAVQYACVDSLVALGKALPAVSLSMSRKLLLITPLTIFLPLLFGADAAFFAEPLADIISCFLSGSIASFIFIKTVKKINF